MKIIKTGDNFAYFVHGKHDKGYIEWSELKKDKGGYITTVNGKNTKGEEIREVTVAIISKGNKPDSTQIFWFVVKVLKKVLCDHCI